MVTAILFRQDTDISFIIFIDYFAIIDIDYAISFIDYDELSIYALFH
jgi:hypothetical protein